MPLPTFFYRRLRWLNLPGAMLVALLQRTPVLRMAATAENVIVASPVGAVLRSLVTAAASLGAVHALAGATQFVTNHNPTSGAVGAAISPTTFTVTGAQSVPGSFRVSNLPPGLTLAGGNSSGLVNGTSGTITGTPTAGGTFTTSVIAYEFNNATGDAFGPLNLVFNIGGSATVAPTITSAPQSASAAAGGSVTFSVTATGSPAPAYQWRKDNLAIVGANGATLTLNNLLPGDSGAYSVTVSNSAGIVTSTAATLVVSAAPTPPAITLQPTGQTIAAGSTVVFSASASGTPAPTFKWLHNGGEIPGAFSSTLVLSGAAASAGGYTAVATNSAGSATSATANLGVISTTDTGRLINLAIRTNAGTGAQTLIVGFAVGGAGTGGAKPLLLRGVGPSLAQFGLTGVLADPVATVFKDATAMANNDNWGGRTDVKAEAASVGAFPLAPDTSLDAALAFTPQPGAYTVQISGNSGGTGIALAEIYDATAATAFAPTTPRLINVSARTQVGTGGDILIAGFVIGGSTSRTVLIRATGPALAAFGVPGTLDDPKLQLFSGAAMIRENDDWGGDDQLAATSAAIGAFALPSASSKDAVLLLTLPPGSYTAQVSGVNGGTGVALVEVYEVP